METAVATKPNEKKYLTPADKSALLQERNKFKNELEGAKTTIARLERELQAAQLANAQFVLPKPRSARDLDDQVIAEVERMAEDGMTEAEMCGAWGISDETWKVWLASTPLLKEAAERARTRARAVMDAMFRKALQTSDRGFPFAKWEGLMEQRYGKPDSETRGSANDVQSKGGRCEVCRDIILED